MGSRPHDATRGRPYLRSSPIRRRGTEMEKVGRSRGAIVAAMLVALAAAAIALANSGSLGQAQKATVAYKNVHKAIAAGYSFRLPDKFGKTCIEQPPQGAMGVHMVNKKLLDSTIDASKPEAMVYQPEPGGKMDLVAIEYVIFKSAWTKSTPPTLFGRQFAFTPAGNRFNLPPYYSLHAWLYKKNPSGLLAPWHTQVSCPT